MKEKLCELQVRIIIFSENIMINLSKQSESSNFFWRIKKQFATVSVRTRAFYVVHILPSNNDYTCIHAIIIAYIIVPLHFLVNFLSTLKPNVISCKGFHILYFKIYLQISLCALIACIASALVYFDWLQHSGSNFWWNSSTPKKMNGNFNHFQMANWYLQFQDYDKNHYKKVIIIIEIWWILK